MLNKKMNMQHPNSMPKPFQTSLLQGRPVRLCAGAALLFLQGCAASSYVPVAYSQPVQVSTYVPPVYVAPAPVLTPAPVVVAPMFNAAQLDQLIGPIALYPDPLLAQLLPAATYPLDIVRAAQLVRGGPTEEQINAQNWDASVKAIAHYPSVLEYMDTNLEWTQQLGQAFVSQPEDVMQSVQRLRTQATAMGNLVTTPQQQVVIDDQGEVGVQYIRIVPAVAEVVYVPVYQPQVVYCEPASFITFGIGFHVGSWLDMDCDWRHRCVYRPSWTWNHWHNHHHIVHNRISYRDRHDNDRYDRHERPSNQWHRDSSRPTHLPGRESQWADRNDRDRDSRGGLDAPRSDRVVGGVTPDAGRGNSGFDRSDWPSQRNTNLDSFRGAPSADQAPTRPNVPALRTAEPVSRPNVPSARPSTPSRPTISPPSRPDNSAQPPSRPPTPQARPNVSAPPSRPAIQAPAPSRPSTPAASPAPSRPSIQTAPAPSRPSTPPAASPAPSRPSTPPPAARPAPQSPPRAAAPAPSRPSTPAPSRPSTPAPSRPQAQPAPPSRPPTPAPAAAPRPSQPAASPSSPPSRPDVPKNPK